jgi:hypothetical protein
MAGASSHGETRSASVEATVAVWFWRVIALAVWQRRQAVCPEVGPGRATDCGMRLSHFRPGQLLK